MASFSFQDIFGLNVLFEEENGFIERVNVGTDSIRDTDNFGDLPVGVGLNSGASPTATQLLYGILMLLKQNQGEKIDTDRTQKVYIQDAGKTIATGTRDGQIKRSFTISFFLEAGIAGVPAVGQIDQSL